MPDKELSALLEGNKWYILSVLPCTAVPCFALPKVVFLCLQTTLGSHLH